MGKIIWKVSPKIHLESGKWKGFATIPWYRWLRPTNEHLVYAHLLSVDLKKNHNLNKIQQIYHVLKFKKNHLN